MSDRIILPSDLIVAGRVLLDVTADGKKRVFEEIGLAFENTDGPTRGVVFKSLLERERLGSTIISDGVAVPHARLENLRQPLAAYLRALEPIQYDGPDALVRHMFVLLAPDKADDVHLKILSIMSRMLTDKEFIKDAEDCSDRAAFLDLVVEWENANLPTNVRNQSATG